MLSLSVALRITHATVDLTKSEPSTFATCGTKGRAMNSFFSKLRPGDRAAPMAIFVNTHSDEEGMGMVAHALRALRGSSGIHPFLRPSWSDHSGAGILLELDGPI